MTILEKAEALARRAHEWQTRRNGEPYIEHPRRVVESLKNLGITAEVVLATAWLHDVMEDWSMEIKKEFTERDSVMDSDEQVVFWRVWWLTKHEDYKTYEDYINSICNDEKKYEMKHQKLIKLCDLFDNLTPETTQAQRQKYLKALSILIN